MSNPLISVILPVYNNATTVEAAARSMLRQTISDMELIIIDDGSSDDSVAVVERIRDPRIRVFRNDRNIGCSASRNRGLDIMRGAYMAPMDADDICHPRRLELTLAVLRARSSIGACGGWARWQGWGMTTYALRLPCAPKAIRAYLLYGVPFHHDTLLFRRETYERSGIRYPEHLRAAVDYDFYYRCAQVAEMENVPAALVKYRFNPAGISNTRAGDATHRRLEGLRRELLLLLPEGIDNASLCLHAKIGNGAGVHTIEELRLARLWLEKLEKANRANNAYDPQGLSTATAMVWFRVCRNSAHLGLAALRAWLRSPWTEYDRPTVQEMSSFAGSWAISRLLKSRRGPQGQLAGL